MIHLNTLVFGRVQLTATALLKLVCLAGAILLTTRIVARAKVALRHTTLRSALVWASVALVAWASTAVLDLGLRAVSSEVADHMWYGSVVLALCPAMAVLGSRRPGTRVWSWFIQVPMLFVLGWPVISLLLQASEWHGLELETPQLLAYLLVLTMGAGNYCGTRFTLSVMCYAIACASIAISSSTLRPAWLANRDAVRVVATALMFFGLWTASRSRSQPADVDRFDRIWLEFLDTFGVVWGRRIQDRVNYMAQTERWTTRLDLHGFVWDDANTATESREATERRMEHTFRWLLRRFVDPPWIDQRLQSTETSGKIAALAADS